MSLENPTTADRRGITTGVAASIGGMLDTLPDLGIALNAAYRLSLQMKVGSTGFPSLQDIACSAR